MRAGALLCLAACSGGALAEIDNAVIVSSQHVGSGVYLGQGLVMTNWHVCFGPPFDESLAEDEYLRYLNADQVEGASPSAFYCGGPGAWRVSATDDGGCQPVSKLAQQQLLFTRIDVEGAPRAARFADWTLDVCLFDVGADAMTALDERLGPVAIEETPVVVGQAVVVAGHQIDALNDVGFETCEVIRAVQSVLDPDPIQPSPLVVPSFAVDCRQVEHGSSGSPVFDAETGKLLGVVWTGVELGTEEAVVWVSAASEWRARLAGRDFSELARVLPGGPRRR